MEANVLIISISAVDAYSIMTTEMIWLYNGTILFVHYHVGYDHDLIEIFFVLNGPKAVIVTVS